MNAEAQLKYLYQKGYITKEQVAPEYQKALEGLDPMEYVRIPGLRDDCPCKRMAQRITEIVSMEKSRSGKDGT